MVFRLKAIFLGLIFIVCFFAHLLLAAESAIPLPTDAVKVSEEGPYFGPIKLYHKRYKTSLNSNELTVFYKKKMLEDGWRENEDRTFIKDSNMVTIMINQVEDKESKTNFMITASKIPTSEEILATRKKNPDKLNFMPVYPGSEQVSLSDLPTGVGAFYETESSVKDVVFFYKSGMLNYGWSLDSQTPVSTQTNLIFRRGSNESCRIRIENVAIDRDNVLPNKTTISVLYHKHEKIKL